MNYGDVNKKSEYNIFSGACNDDGNVIGTMIHNILDENPIIRNNLLNYIDASSEDIEDISAKNKEVKSKINMEVGIDSGHKIEKLSGEFLKYKNNGKGPKFLMIGSNGSDSGKTFILTGLAGALRKKRSKSGSYESRSRCKRYCSWPIPDKRKNGRLRIYKNRTSRLDGY